MTEPNAKPTQAAGLHRLKPLQITKAQPGDKLSDGGGLYLVCGKGAGKSWAFYYFPEPGKRRELYLGPAEDLTLVAARELAATLRAAHVQGTDPKAALNAMRAEAKAASAPAPKRMTFRQAAEAYIAAKRDGWKNAKHAAQWPASLEAYVYPEIGDTAVADVNRAAVLSVLRPIWNEKPETASRVRGRIELVMDFASGNGWIDEDRANPALRGPIEGALHARSKGGVAKHHAACVVDDVPTLYARLAASDSTAAAATRFCLLTAARPGEVANALWPEIDRDAKVWTVPAEKQKRDKPHRVALSDEALAVLDMMRQRRENDKGYVFPGRKRGRPLSLPVMQKALLEAMGDDLQTDQEGRRATTHGTARATFDNWGSERTHHPEKLIDRALAHGPKVKTIAAYRRSELLEQRRPLMDDWARFLCGTTADNVVTLRPAAAAGVAA